MLLLFAGCTGVHTPLDGGGDAAAPTRAGCGDVYNALDTYYGDCDHTAWFCPWSGPVTDTQIHACTTAIFDATDRTCGAELELLGSCR